MHRETVIVYSQLRWDKDSVRQRPHHIMTRMAEDNTVVFVEEPWWHNEGDSPHLVIYQMGPNLTVAKPIVPRQWQNLPRITKSNQAIIRELLGYYFTSRGLSDVIRWHYSPMYTFAEGLTSEKLVVYDCMDELAAFSGAPKELVQRERELLCAAELVFTGGRTIFEAKRPYTLRCYRFDSGVDVEHFAKAKDAATQIPLDLSVIPKPIVGYFGVIDERMDYEALTAMAETHPEWSLVLIGPTMKVRRKSLPKTNNIHYLGIRSYELLPGYLRGFDVATVLFADNKSTRSLSPTKTLEYFAGGKPVISGPIPDVIQNFQDLVQIARTPGEWICAVEETLTGYPDEKIKRASAVAQSHTWDSIVCGMMEHVDQLLVTTS